MVAMGAYFSHMDPNTIRKWALVHYDYNPVTGVFTNRISGQPVTRKHTKGYVQIEIMRKKYFAHRVAYLIMEGVWPKQIDHRNRVRDDNRWENLLNATQMLNAQNHGLRKTSKSGLSGVCWMGKHKWEASLTRNNHRMKKRGIATKEEASAVRDWMLAQWEAGNWPLKEGWQSEVIV